MFMEKNNQYDYLITLGIDDEQGQQVSSIKIWDSEGILQRTVQISDSKTIKKATCFAVSSDMTMIAIGLHNGQILFYKGKFYAKSDKTLSERVISTPPKISITNVFILQKKAQQPVLFVTTINQVFSYYIQEKAETYNELTQVEGCAHQCSALNETHELLIAAMAAKETVSLIEADTMVRTWSFEGEKSIIKTFKNNIIIVAIVKSMSQLTIIDLVNKFISHQTTLHCLDHVVCEDDGINVVSKNKNGEITFQKLIEKDHNKKIELLFKRNAFELAANIAEQVGYDKNFQAEIYKMHADHLYSKRDWDGAIEFYKNTVGFLEASYVILKFLDASLIDYLTQYLETIHQRRKATKEHTALLLNCYVNLKQMEKLKRFLDQQSEDVQFYDPMTAIEVCCESKCWDVALNLAEKAKLHIQYVKILLEEQQKYQEVLDYIQTKVQSAEQSARILKEIGQKLMNEKPKETYSLILKIIQQVTFDKNIDTHMQPDQNQQETPETFDIYDQPKTLTYRQFIEYILSVFVDHWEEQGDFLRYLIQRQQNIDQFVYHKLFEFYLQLRKMQIGQQAIMNVMKSSSKRSEKRGALRIEKNITDEAINQKSEAVKKVEQDIKELLENANNRYDKNHVLMLFQMHTFSEGQIYLHNLMENKQELMNSYINNNDLDNIMHLCQMYGKEDQDLWLQALTHFVSNKDPKCETLIVQVLNEVDFLSPLIVIEILSRNPSIQLKVIKKYLQKKLLKDKQEIQKNNEEIQNNRQRSAELRNQLQRLKYQNTVFQSTKCVQCELKLQFPSVHFMCQHSYHQHCLLDNERRCIKCTPDMQQALDRKLQLQQQKEKHEDFFKELYGSSEKFNIISKYFGRGLID